MHLHRYFGYTPHYPIYLSASLFPIPNMQAGLSFGVSTLLFLAITACGNLYEKAELPNHLVIVEYPSQDEYSLCYRVGEGDYIPIKGVNTRCVYTTTAYVLLKNDITINTKVSLAYYLFPLDKATPQEVDDGLIGPLDQDSLRHYLSAAQVAGARKHCF
ncbi:hypothetical protein [Hymenobacter cellulosilyticus]|uniref:Uncharacterized protein n=1 Tax=Hymenobacter cellulosilyticus TaxID=2932248 RepID=A0A8T9QBE3_9BACT|nr:hypothetical protein [Hymenobacter cellulosilyticus]UOQ74505.1 hypothetical protein MUN79_11850 [Hymenobacter cellulosilyticus]